MRWALAIVFGSPTLRIAEKCEVQSAVTLRQQPELRVPYSWFVMDAGTVHGVSTLSTGLTQGTIVLHRQPDGFHWTIAETSVTYSDGWSDIKVLHQAQRDNGLVVAAHPAIHGFPWVVPDAISSRQALRHLKRQPYQRVKGDLGKGLNGVLLRLQQSAERNERYCAARNQTPRELWRHRNAITEYQVWVYYRMALHQLNCYSPGRELNNCCRKLSVCHGQRRDFGSHLLGLSSSPGLLAGTHYLLDRMLGDAGQRAALCEFLHVTKVPAVTSDHFSAAAERVWTFDGGICMSMEADVVGILFYMYHDVMGATQSGRSRRAFRHFGGMYPRMHSFKFSAITHASAARA
uniref:Uncharacterized protein n=1 Tax=Peronospora matthiolae TaxID=2874970 RepID=A0AAV1V9I2_9STRA